jgi:ribosomal RNA-processing protein 17
VQDLVIEFDADDRKDFLTGFRRRKNARRKRAKLEQERQERRERIRERAERKVALLEARGVDEEQLKERIKILEEYDDGGRKRERDDSENANKGDGDDQVQEYDTERSTITVTTQPLLDTLSDEEDALDRYELSESSGDEDLCAERQSRVPLPKPDPDELRRKRQRKRRKLKKQRRR